eukprot:TRINITY_DN2953_c0_g4_i1.p1 TRINITY_DN2953_c0_g4~~TRINITY_DN2953_c0_g4_i1.p1  ORF type:complete len:109 (-),score=24.54 TRINITY_DN2953_c0_g4_i1:171-497(-)
MSQRAVSKLAASVRSTYLSPLLQNGWKVVQERDAIQKTFIFKDFHQAWNFMSDAVPEINKADHHPEWFNVYSKVDILLTTHDCGGLSDKDVHLAKHFDELQAKINKSA